MPLEPPPESTVVTVIYMQTLNVASQLVTLREVGKPYILAWY